jgi:penicillin-binding protein 1A
MNITKKRNLVINILLGATIVSAILIGIALGSGIADVINSQPDIGSKQMAEVSKIYDINGNLITELFSEEKRNWVSYYDIPKCLIQALITKEDREFYEHGGFSLWNTLRAFWNNITGGYFSGGSTLTQQIAGFLYTNRTEKTVFRKIAELWFALQLEKKLSKEEILELYLNKMYFGHGCYGVEAASEYYFSHSVQEISPAEAAILVNTLSNATLNSPFKDPDRARKMQKNTLNDMIGLGFITEEEATESFEKYWKGYDITRGDASAFLTREDKAPYFSSFVQQELEEILMGDMNIYQDGLEIYTTLNLEYQKCAQKLMENAIDEFNGYFKDITREEIEYGDEVYLPVIDLLSLTLNMPQLHVKKKRHIQNVINYYSEDVDPALNLVTSMFGLTGAKTVSQKSYKREVERLKRSKVQGALVSIDIATGHILAMVGGREFSPDSAVNYATQSVVQPGSAFKPLFYCAGIERQLLTAATLLKNKKIVIFTPSGPYLPKNYSGDYGEDVTVRDALARSLNLPAINALEIIKFDPAISMASSLFGITDPEEIDRTFPRVFPLALGIVTTNPLQMARAFSTFPNKGRAVEPIAIRFVKNRKGKIIFEPEKEALARQQQAGDKLQLMSPQTAYIMVDILKSTVDWGTISGAYHKYLADSPHEYAGKTGTTQNWHDVWTIGFSAQITTAIWFGFDKGGRSLGTFSTGASEAAPVWAKFMGEIHKNLPVKHFERPPGLVNISICRKSGMLPSKYCDPKDVRSEIFLIGTEPKGICDVCKFGLDQKQGILIKLQSDFNLHEQLNPEDALRELAPDDYVFSEEPPSSLDEYDVQDLMSNEEEKEPKDKPKPKTNNESTKPKEEGDYLLLDE